MKKTERDAARALREKGLSMNEIAKQLNVSKASVSLWVRDVVLTKGQREKLNAQGFSVDAIEKRRIKRIENTRQRHRTVIESAKEDITGLSERELFLVGVALYWGEGGKTGKGMARVANADPAVIRFMMRFFREICSVPEERFRGHVHTFSHLNASEAERYWSDVSGISIKQFYKTYSKPSAASKHKKDTLPYGTFQIYVCDTELFLRIKGWIESLSEIGSQNLKPLV